MRKYLNASVVNMIQTCYKNPTDLKLSMSQDFLSFFNFDTPMNLRLQNCRKIPSPAYMYIPHNSSSLKKSLNSIIPGWELRIHRTLEYRELFFIINIFRTPPQYAIEE